MISPMPATIGQVNGSPGVYVAPACGYPSLQKGIHPTPPHPR